MMPPVAPIPQRRRGLLLYRWCHRSIRLSFTTNTALAESRACWQVRAKTEHVLDCCCASKRNTSTFAESLSRLNTESLKTESILMIVSGVPGTGTRTLTAIF